MIFNEIYLKIYTDQIRGKNWWKGLIVRSIFWDKDEIQFRYDVIELVFDEM